MISTALTTRLALRGPESLSDAELFAIVCSVSIHESEAVLAGDAPKSSASHAKLDALMTFARRRDCARMLPTLDRAHKVAALLQPELGPSDVEELHALALDSRNRLLRHAKVARGTVNQVMATARDVFRPLIAAGAARAIVAHNHPSGDASPSVEDRELTLRLAAAGDLLGIPVVDHLIVSRGGWFSFAAETGGSLRPISTQRRQNR